MHINIVGEAGGVVSGYTCSYTNIWQVPNRPLQIGRGIANDNDGFRDWLIDMPKRLLILLCSFRTNFPGPLLLLLTISGSW